VTILDQDGNQDIGHVEHGNKLKYSKHKMVNNKFHISESERKRIIQNHIVATKKQYLKEDEMDMVSVETEKPDFYTELRDLTMPYYKRYQDDGKKLSSEERIERIKHTIEELKSYISILESEISNEDDRITEYGE
jgi:hypothetical protein